jgi:hypothetical protein
MDENLFLKLQDQDFKGDNSNFNHAEIKEISCFHFSF